MQATRLKNVALGFSSNADIDKRTQKDNENKKEKEMDRGKEGSVGNISSRNSTELPPVRESLRSLRSEKARYSTAQYSTPRDFDISVFLSFKLHFSFTTYEFLIFKFDFLFFTYICREILDKIRAAKGQ